jgi:hypothetical protein
MIDPLDIVRAVSTLTAATVVGCGVLNWYTRDAHATKGGAIWRTRAATLIFAAAGIGVVANALGAIGASAAAAAAADSHAFSFSGPLLEAYLTQTGVGHITILQFGSAAVACLLAGLAWFMLKKTPASDVLLLSAAVAAGFSQAVSPSFGPSTIGASPARASPAPVVTPSARRQSSRGSVAATRPSSLAARVAFTVEMMPPPAQAGYDLFRGRCLRPSDLNEYEVVKLYNASSTPYASMSAKSCPSTPAAPLLERRSASSAGAGCFTASHATSDLLD